MATLADKLMVLNAGSSSLKFKLFELGAGDSLRAIASGLCERIGDPTNSSMKAQTSPGHSPGAREIFQEPMPDHTSALQLVSRFLASSFKASFAEEVHSVGHRVVHGRELSDPLLVDERVRGIIQQAADLAPLHNPPNLQGIDAAKATFPHARQVAVFDTAFHATMPPASFMYALPYELYVERAIRRYGFHGTSYKYLTQRAAAMLGKEEREVNLILCHLGAGSSMCAVQGGRSIDTTMGLTPLEGLMMGSRCGDIDPAIVPFLMGKGMSVAEVDTLMNKKSGFLGLAVDVFVRRVRKYLGAYLVHLGGRVDAVVFSAGIGENSALMRGLISEGLEWAGLSLDEVKNRETVAQEGDISSGHARVKCLVIPTDEELSIAQQTLQVVRSVPRGGQRSG